jgi:hypothetical protein
VSARPRQGASAISSQRRIRNSFVDKKPRTGKLRAAPGDRVAKTERGVRSSDGIVVIKLNFIMRSQKGRHGQAD